MERDLLKENEQRKIMKTCVNLMGHKLSSNLLNKIEHSFYEIGEYRDFTINSSFMKCCIAVLEEKKRYDSKYNQRIYMLEEQIIGIKRVEDREGEIPEDLLNKKHTLEHTLSVLKQLRR